MALARQIPNRWVVFSWRLGLDFAVLFIFVQPFRRQGFGGAGTELADFLSPADEGIAESLAFSQLVHGVMVGGLGRVEPHTDGLEVFREGDKFVVQQAALFGDLQDAAVLLFLPPDEGNGPHGRQQGRGGDQHDILVQGVEE